MEPQTRKSCCKCSSYCVLANQGMWWCNAGHTDNMDPETCGDYDGSLDEGAVYYYASTDTVYVTEDGQTFKYTFATEQE